MIIIRKKWKKPIFQKTDILGEECRKIKQQQIKQLFQMVTQIPNFLISSILFLALAWVILLFPFKYICLHSKCFLNLAIFNIQSNAFSVNVLDCRCNAVTLQNILNLNTQILQQLRVTQQKDHLQFYIYSFLRL
ncbi:unnamed protein product [Paramecium sonneborni]|uniref:Transmembrane protein n=1 Tax=Paramecium sonneborni TaxID=65129 RepID=A0A8S1MSA0_9CILI|nr:unnamed protein product [Paramecium sonneborni]